MKQANAAMVTRISSVIVSPPQPSQFFSATKIAQSDRAPGLSSAAEEKHRRGRCVRAPPARRLGTAGAKSAAATVLQPMEDHRPEL